MSRVICLCSLAKSHCPRALRLSRTQKEHFVRVLSTLLILSYIRSPFRLVLVIIAVERPDPPTYRLFRPARHWRLVGGLLVPSGTVRCDSFRMPLRSIIAFSFTTLSPFTLRHLPHHIISLSRSNLEPATTRVRRRPRFGSSPSSLLIDYCAVSDCLISASASFIFFSHASPV